MEKNLDYIVVGQGLAGSCIALQLLKRQKQFVVIDQPEKNVCTRVAAGLFNPVTGQNLVKSWLTDFIFPFLHDFYSHAERHINQKFLHSLPVYRPFQNIEEQNEWMARSADETYYNVIDTIFTKPAFENVRNPLGGILLKNTGFINTMTFVEGVRKLIQEGATFRNEHFDHGKLKIIGDSVTYDDLEAKKIIFCEGYSVADNPWFNILPIRALKGETLTIKTHWSEQVILNRGVYMVPLDYAGHFRVGSTYNLRDKEKAVTEAGRIELETKLRDLLTASFQVTGQEWGIRPTTTDRRPILGLHPIHKSLAIFNGLGTKGVSLAPYFSEMLIQRLENDGSPLNKEADVTRYKLLY